MHRFSPPIPLAETRFGGARGVLIAMFSCKSPLDRLAGGVVARIVQIVREASMKHWQETSRILQSLLNLAEQGRTAALATVIHIEGSAYRRPGAKMLILDDGAM